MQHFNRGKEEYSEKIKISDQPIDSHLPLPKKESPIKVQSNVVSHLALKFDEYERRMPLVFASLKLFLVVLFVCYFVGFATGFFYTCFRGLYSVAGHLTYVLHFGNLFALYAVCGGLACQSLFYILHSSKFRRPLGFGLLLSFFISPLIVILAFVFYYELPVVTQADPWFLWNEVFGLVQTVGFNSLLGAGTSIFVAL